MKDPIDIDPLDSRIKEVANVLLDCMGPNGSALGVFETARHVIAWHENQIETEFMTLLETIERARKHWRNLPPHIKERDTASRLKDLLDIVDTLQHQTNRGIDEKHLKSSTLLTDSKS